MEQRPLQIFQQQKKQKKFAVTLLRVYSIYITGKKPGEYCKTMKAAELTAQLKSELRIFDGGIGTEIYRRNFFINTSFEQLSLTAPNVIREIHRQYNEAGAEAATTNTYNANRLKLKEFGLSDKTEEINRSSVALAREVCGQSVWIAGTVGPLNSSTFAEKVSTEEAGEVLAEQAGYLLDGGADLLVFESLSNAQDIDNLLDAVRRLRQKYGEDLPFVPSFSINGEGKFSDGSDFETLYRSVCQIRPPAIGFNCGCGPDELLKAMEKIAPMLQEPWIVQPNAGNPKKVDCRTIYLTSPEYFTTYILRFIELGARGVGGCCGITPAHIAEMSRSVKPVTAARRHPATVTVTMEDANSAWKEAVPMAERSQLGKKLAEGSWIRTVEITPPPGFDLTKVIANAKLCKDAGIDAINLPDGPRASARMTPLAAAIRIQQEANIETVLHMCCRDRSLIGLQAELLSCAVSGVNNILFITGDPPKLGKYHNSSGVYDVDSIGLAQIGKMMNHGLDASGQPFDGVTRFLMASGADPNAIDQEREYRRTCEKVEAGAEWIITQPVFDEKPLLKFIERIAHLKVPVLAGVWPLASYRNAEFMRNEVPGVVVPDEIMTRMAHAETKEEQRDLGIRIARETIEKIKGHVCGVQVSAPFGNVRTALAVHYGEIG